MAETTDTGATTDATDEDTTNGDSSDDVELDPQALNDPKRISVDENSRERS